MKFKTRLMITFLTIVLLPLILTAIAFVSIGGYLMNAQKKLDTINIDYNMMSDPGQAFEQISEDVLNEVKAQMSTDEKKIENIEYLTSLNSAIEGKASYIIVRKGNAIYYAGNTVAAERIFSSLPEYGYANANGGSGYYYNNMEKLVKQLDFQFSDGEKGSFFVVTKATPLISKTLLADMFLAIIVILIFTSVILTRWIHKVYLCQ